jgi:hypothetical protein
VSGESASFVALGLDQQGGRLNPTVAWSATGGDITPEGLYTAGGTEGGYLVTAADESGIDGSAVVLIGSSVGVEETPGALPSEFALHQSHPNPFNPRALVPCDVKEAVRVVLKVYDVLGREVATLVDGNHAPGRYVAAFDAGDLSSGIYFYAIEMGAFRAVRRMVLVR